MVIFIHLNIISIFLHYFIFRYRLLERVCPFFTPEMCEYYNFYPKLCNNSRLKEDQLCV